MDFYCEYTKRNPSKQRNRFLVAALKYFLTILTHSYVKKHKNVFQKAERN